MFSINKHTILKFEIILFQPQFNILIILYFDEIFKSSNIEKRSIRGNNNHRSLLRQDKQLRYV